MRDGGDVYGGLVWLHLVTGLPCVDWNQVRFLDSLVLVCILCIITVPPWHNSVYFCSSTFLMQSLPPLHMVQNVTFVFCSSFSVYQHLAVWGNIVIFYILNLILSLSKHAGMYTIMFRVCADPAYWLSLLVCASFLASQFLSFHWAEESSEAFTWSPTCFGHALLWPSFFSHAAYSCCWNGAFGGN